MAKRANGEGSIFKRADGKWVGSLTMDSGATGKRKRRVVYGKTQKQVRDKLEALRNDQRHGLLVSPDSLTVSELMTRWLDEWSPSLAASSRHRYRQMSNLYIVPNLGTVAVQKLKKRDVLALIDKLVADDVGERTRHYVYATIRRALSLAVDRDILPVHPLPRGKGPKWASKPVNPPNDKDLAAILKAAKGERLEALIVLAVTTGMRQGELFAVEWQDIDLTTRLLTVRQSLEEVQGRLALKPPKSKAGYRTVKLPAVAVDALTRHRDQTVKIGGTVFTDADGKWLRKSNFLRKTWQPILERAGLAGVRFHDLRHAHVSSLIAANVHAKVIQRRLGHSSITVTMDRYGHLMTDDDVAADATEAAFAALPKAGGYTVATNDQKTAAVAVSDAS